jgi:hypothetical protein
MPEATNTSPADEVPAEAAYVAARDRAMRTTQALIEAEARIVDLSWRLDVATGDNQQLRADLTRYQEVTCDAPSDEADRPPSCGEADSTPTFSD